MYEKGWESPLTMHISPLSRFVCKPLTLHVNMRPSQYNHSVRTATHGIQIWSSSSLFCRVFYLISARAQAFGAWVIKRSWRIFVAGKWLRVLLLYSASYREMETEKFGPAHARWDPAIGWMRIGEGDEKTRREGDDSFWVQLVRGHFKLILQETATFKLHVGKAITYLWRWTRRSTSR